MTVTTRWYAAADLAAYNKEVDYLSDTIKVALLGSGYTPALDTHDYYNDVSASEVSGAGYTAGGATLASKTMVYTAANSWGTAWASATAYGAEAIVRPATGNGYLYRAQGAGGTSGGSEPTWPTTVGDEVTDGGVTWTNIGRGLITFDAADPSWASATIAARYAVVYDSTGTASTSPLLWLIDFGEVVSSTAATFAITFAALGIAYKAIF